MNNVQKAFKNKGTCGLADGGRPHPNTLGTGGAAVAAGLRRKPNGGEVEGPGGPTDDEAGLYDLSNDEYVLPADTVEAMGGAEALDEVRDATHEFVDEKNRPGLANGGLGGAYDWLKGKAGSGLQAGKDALSSMRGGQPATPAQPGAPSMPKIDPKTVSNGFTNAQRVAATPSGYVTGGLAPAPSKAMSFAKGVGTKVAAPLAVASAVGDSAAEDSTARYAKRFGVSEPTGDGSAGDMVKFAGLRAGGFASDLGNALTLGAAGNLYRDKPDGMLQFNGEAKATSALEPTVQAPAQAPATQAPATPEQIASDQERARVSQELLGEGVSAADQGDSRMSFSDAQASSMRGLGAGKQYKLGGGGNRSTVPGALDGSVYDEGNADIFATSTRKDGKLNSFTGVGNANRPNWEDRPENRQAHLDSLARADKDIAAVAERERGLERGRQEQANSGSLIGRLINHRARLAEATHQRTLEVEGVKNAAVERTEQARGLAAGQKAAQEQKNWEKTNGLAQRTAGREDKAAELAASKDTAANNLAQIQAQSVGPDGKLDPEKFRRSLNFYNASLQQNGQTLGTADPQTMLQTRLGNERAENPDAVPIFNGIRSAFGAGANRPSSLADSQITDVRNGLGGKEVLQNGAWIPLSRITGAGMFGGNADTGQLQAVEQSLRLRGKSLY